LRYFINPIYLDNYQNEILITNKYCDKHQFFLKHHLLYGNKLQTLHKDYLPFSHPLKNEQYLLQKKMSFNIPLLKQKFLERYPDLIKVYNWWKTLKQIKLNKSNIDKIILKDALKDKYQECIGLFSKCIDFHNHIFKATEKYGRIYMPFHMLPKEFRKAIKIEINNKFYNIKEIFDLKCCFVQLSALIALSQLQPDDKFYKEKLLEFTKVKQQAKNDIYSDILLYINNNKLTRLDIKKQIMFWLFSKEHQRINVSKTNIVINGINEYFKNKFPYFYEFIIQYPVCNSDQVLKSNSFKLKSISKLSIDCFNMEAQIMFNNILPYYKQQYNTIISLHDGIYTLNNTLNITIKYIYDIINIWKLNILKYIKNNNKNIYCIINYYLCGVNCFEKFVPRLNN